MFIQIVPWNPILDQITTYNLCWYFFTVMEQNWDVKGVFYYFFLQILTYNPFLDQNSTFNL